MVASEMAVDQEKFVTNKPVTENRQPKNAPSQKTAMPRWSQKGKEKSSIARMCTWVVDHQLAISANFLSILIFIHVFFPTLRSYTQKFFRISYYNNATGTFALGWDDIFFVFYWIVVFTGMRCAVMEYILSPFAQSLGISNKKQKIRFAEQAWILIYYALFWSTGMYIMYNSDYWLNLRALWKDWPMREMSGLSKWYYLVQFAFWLQQIVVVHIEERRKDHWQMFTHHVITCTLIFTSYGYHQTKVGTLILCLMDVVDLLFPLAKMLKYLHYQMACDVCFGLFMVTWFVARHIFYMWTCWSIYYHIPQEIQYGCYRGGASDLQGPYPVPNDWEHLTQPFRDPVGLVCWNDNVKWTFLALLLALQAVMCVWFCMILKVAYKVISGQGADDTRSDDEDEDEEEEEDTSTPKSLATDTKSPTTFTNMTTQPQFIERESTSTDSNFSISKSKSTRSRTPVRKASKRSAESSSVNVLAGNSDRKELLGRIGCDKAGLGDQSFYKMY